MTDWCSALRQTLFISQMAIPGTHDSAAWTHHENVPSITPATWAHRKSIPEQLDMGVRALDLRVGYRLGWTGGYSVGMYHGPVDLNISLEQVLTEINAWLRDHPGEFVILIFQQQGKLGTKSDISTDVKKLVDTTLGDRLFPFRPSISRWPTIENLRGRVLAMSRLPGAVDKFCDVRPWLNLDNTEGAGFKVGDELPVYLQDRYKGLSSAKVIDDAYEFRAKTAIAAGQPPPPPPPPIKEDYVRKMALVDRASALGLEHSKILIINHLSHSSVLRQPWQIGQTMNKMLRESKFVHRGFLMIDDADADTVNHIIRYNYR